MGNVFLGKWQLTPPGGSPLAFTVYATGGANIILGQADSTNYQTAQFLCIEWRNPENPDTLPYTFAGYAMGCPYPEVFALTMAGTSGCQFTDTMSNAPGRRDPMSGYLGWNGGLTLAGAPCTFGLTVLTPGVAALQQSKAGAGADFTGVDLSGADLTGCDFHGARFTGANLAGAVLHGVNLAGAALDATNLTGTDFTGADLSGASLTGATLAGTVLTTALLSGANLSNCDLSQAVFDATTVFNGTAGALTQLAGSVLDVGVLNLNWSYLNLAGATLQNVPQSLEHLQAVSSNLTGVQLPGMSLRYACFDGAVLTAANFAGADLSFATFRSATLAGDDLHDAANCSSATLFDAAMTSANLSGVILSGAYFYGGNASVSGATMVGVKCNNAYLEGLDFSDIADQKLENASFDGACLVNCNFSGSATLPLQGAASSFEGACLQGANFADANLDGANLVDAAVAAAAGQLVATLQIDGQSVPVPLTFGPTILPASSTGAGTTCPDTSMGPCGASQLSSTAAPTAWPNTKVPTA